MMICWFCWWGWHPQVKAIFDEAVAQIGDQPLLHGPSHVVWSNENFDSAQWCLDHFGEYNCVIFSYSDLAIVRQSLERLVKLPAEFKVEPADYDGKHPENYPPFWLTALVRAKLVLAEASR